MDRWVSKEEKLTGFYLFFLLIYDLCWIGRGKGSRKVSTFSSVSLVSRGQDSCLGRTWAWLLTTVEVFFLTTHCGADACPWVAHPGVGAAAQGTADAEEAWEGDQSPALAQVGAVTSQPLVLCCIPTLGLLWSPSALLKSRCRYTRDSPSVLARVQSTAFKTSIINIVPTKFRPEVFKWAWEGFQDSTYTGPTVVKIISDSGQARVHRLKHFIQRNKPAQGSKGERDHNSLVFFILMATSIIQDNSSNSSLGDSYFPPFRWQTGHFIEDTGLHLWKHLILWTGVSRFSWVQGQFLLAAFVLHWRS